MSESAPLQSLPSFAQERRFCAPVGSPVWNILFALRIEGSLALPTLERCLGEIVRRHQILRSEIRTIAGRAVLAVCECTPPRVPCVDVERPMDAAADRDEELRRLLVTEACTPFDFPRQPLFRFKALKLAQAEHLLLLTFHHSIFDGGWSLNVLLHELRLLYEAFEKESPSPLSELPLQYSDYAASQRNKYRGEALQRDVARRRARFAGAPRALALPTDRPRPPVRTFQGACRTFKISASLTRTLKSLSRGQGATLFITLLTAFTVLLHRASAQDQILVGTAVATRNQPGTRDLIGNFVNFLPLLTDLSGNPSFVTAIGRVRRAFLEACADPELPFEALVDALDPFPDPGRPPLCQVFFTWRGPTPPSQHFSGMTVSLASSEFLTNSCKADLHIHLGESANEICVEVEYCTDLFEAATVDRLLNSYLRLLDLAAASPAHPIGELANVIAAAPLDGAFAEGCAGRAGPQTPESHNARCE